MVDAVVFADAPARLFPLLARRTPAIQCLAAAALICPNPFRPAPLNYRDCYQTLVEGGIDPGDATWMMGLHHRDRLEHKCEQGEARLRYLEAMLCYKHLWTVEQTFRTAKHLLSTRPIFHKLDETIRGHVFAKPVGVDPDRFGTIPAQAGETSTTAAMKWGHIVLRGPRRSHA